MRISMSMNAYTYHTTPHHTDYTCVTINIYWASIVDKNEDRTTYVFMNIDGWLGFVQEGLR